jgi:hypothetical protein
MRIFTENEQLHLAALQNYQLVQRQVIQQYLQMDQMIRRMRQIETHYASLFEHAETILQQHLLVIAEPEGTQLFPKVTDVTFWSHAYRKVAIDGDNLNANVVSLKFVFYTMLIFFSMTV